MKKTIDPRLHSPEIDFLPLAILGRCSDHLVEIIVFCGNHTATSVHRFRGLFRPFGIPFGLNVPVVHEDKENIFRSSIGLRTEPAVEGPHPLLPSTADGASPFGLNLNTNIDFAYIDHHGSHLCNRHANLPRALTGGSLGSRRRPHPAGIGGCDGSKDGIQFESWGTCYCCTLDPMHEYLLL
ncbi:hypothetical protein CC1G_14886 [Coprinopsis cinerea okayama7|uniref:Uncharacterized protein n=1 Tax=Coprinopsis cinerea (strain Okayama-7 / 130 / ATCC MYA-4618 / FGSC 9003) TaxID=240176 RepID=D6RNJ9_COPC7|nr:hypothetical protein CC1G_14886 [Coprinopsis cinerea okayama7\|eukprot:XP_002910909.1 hypothetical protein CC1G_14886 [Coprinopsis cinerea okayama7\